MSRRRFRQGTTLRRRGLSDARLAAMLDDIAWSKQRVVDLRGNGLRRPETLRALLSRLNPNVLVSLDLSRNELGADALNALATYTITLLPHTTLTLDDNPGLTDTEAVLALLSSPTLATLHKLVIRSPHVPSPTIDALCFADPLERALLGASPERNAFLPPARQTWLDTPTRCGLSARDPAGRYRHLSPRHARRRLHDHIQARLREATEPDELFARAEVIFQLDMSGVWQLNTCPLIWLADTLHTLDPARYLREIHPHVLAFAERELEVLPHKTPSPSWLADLLRRDSPALALINHLTFRGTNEREVIRALHPTPHLSGLRGITLHNIPTPDVAHIAAALPAPLPPIALSPMEPEAIAHLLTHPLSEVSTERWYHENDPGVALLTALLHADRVPEAIFIHMHDCTITQTQALSHASLPGLRHLTLYNCSIEHMRALSQAAWLASLDTITFGVDTIKCGTLHINNNILQLIHTIQTRHPTLQIRAGDLVLPQPPQDAIETTP